jgi:predicted nucleotidyltransferase
MQTSLTRSLERMVESIVKRYSPERIILFGSHASGTADADSDLDLLVVMTPRGSKAEQELDILKSLRRYRMPKDVIVTTPQDYAWRKEVPGTIERPAAISGHLLYEKR